MKKSLIAAAFVAALPFQSFAQENDDMERSPLEQTTCIQLNASAEFCHAANEEGVQISSNGLNYTVIPGYVQDGMARYSDCAAFFDDQSDIPAHVECF